MYIVGGSGEATYWDGFVCPAVYPYIESIEGKSLVWFRLRIWVSGCHMGKEMWIEQKMDRLKDGHKFRWQKYMHKLIAFSDIVSTLCIISHTEDGQSKNRTQFYRKEKTKSGHFSFGTAFSICFSSNATFSFNASVIALSMSMYCLFIIHTLRVHVLYVLV